MHEITGAVDVLVCGAVLVGALVASIAAITSVAVGVLKRYTLGEAYKQAVIDLTGADVEPPPTPPDRPKLTMLRGGMLASGLAAGAGAVRDVVKQKPVASAATLAAVTATATVALAIATRPGGGDKAPRAREPGSTRTVVPTARRSPSAHPSTHPTSGPSTRIPSQRRPAGVGGHGPEMISRTTHFPSPPASPRPSTSPTSVPTSPPPTESAPTDPGEPPPSVQGTCILRAEVLGIRLSVCV